MPGPSSFRDSTQIVVPSDVLDGIRSDLDEEFTVTVFESGKQCRIIGSPVEIKAVGNFLTRHGIPVE